MRKVLLIGLIFLAVGLLAGFVHAQQQPIKIGVLFVNSGPMGGYGKHGFQAIRMALDDINARGGILGRKVEAVYGDTQLKLPVATEIATRFVKQDKVDFIIGPTSSGIAGAVSKIAADNKKILVLAQAAADSLTGSDFNPYHFATLSNAMMHARSGAYYVASKPYKRWMCIGPNYNYGWDSWAQFKGKLKGLRPDVEFVGEVWPKLTEKDFAPFIKKIIEAKPDAVWSPLWGMDAMNFIRQAKAAGLFETIKFAFPDGAALETLVPLGREMPDGTYTSARYFFLTPDAPANHAFVKAYLDRFKEYPDYMAEEAYAAVYFIKAAAERAGTTDADKIIAAVDREPLAWATPEGWKIMGPDHAVIEDVVWGETVYDPKFNFSVLKDIQSIQAEQICRTPEELRQVRADYGKRLKEKK